MYAQDIKLAEYNGELHMTFYAGNDPSTGSRGHGVIQNNKYHTVQTVSSGLGRASTDTHEFTVLNEGKTAIVSIFQPSPYDLSSFRLDQPWGWVGEGIFQEIDVATGEVLFEWRSLDHAQTLPSQTYNTYGSNGTNSGATVSLVWDYL